jgi:hypothetical protein
VLKQYGEKRTGTNLLRYCLTQNAPNVLVLVHVLGGKHSPPVDLADVWKGTEGTSRREQAFVETATQKRPAETTRAGDSSQAEYLRMWGPTIGRAYTEQQLRFAISIKDPYAWIVSVRRIEKWPSADDASSIALACRRFNRRYREWAELKTIHHDRVRVIRYEELLRDLPGTMNGFIAWLGLSNQSASWAVPSTAMVPTHWDDAPTRPADDVPFDPEYYTTRRYLERLSPVARAVVRAEIDWGLFGDLGYDRDGAPV